MTDARQTALDILNRLDRQTDTLDRILDDMLPPPDRADKKNRALTHALVFGVTRWKRKLDWIIARFSRTPLEKIEPAVLNILRLGVYQLLSMDRIPDSAAVNTSVELGKAIRKTYITRFINGLLRNIARQKAGIVFPSMEKNPLEHLSVCYSLPPWLVQKWMGQYPVNEVISICRSVNRIPPITIRTNTLAAVRSELKQYLAADVATIAKTPHSPVGLTLTGPRVPIMHLNGFSRGWFQVQDEAAQLVSLLAGPEPGQEVLDACAGLGGKTGHLAQLMQNRGSITAMDNSESKLRILTSEMDRLGIDIVRTVPLDLHAPIRSSPKKVYDNVLLDAPCSGLGVIRRNPDGKWNVSERSLKTNQNRQVDFLDSLADLVRPGGRLTYAVCSTEPEENEQVVERFLSKHPDFQLEDRSGSLPAGVAGSMYREHCLQTFPHRDDMDGFFAACFQKSPA